MPENAERRSNANLPRPLKWNHNTLLILYSLLYVALCLLQLSPVWQGGTIDESVQFLTKT